MSETIQPRWRIEKKLVANADAVFAELGVDPGTAVSMFFAQVVKLRALPFRPAEFPALEEYGATLAQADAAEAAVVAEFEDAAARGKVVEFKGKL